VLPSARLARHCDARNVHLSCYTSKFDHFSETIGGRSPGWHKAEETIDTGSMCYVIVTGRSLLWTLLSLAALMAVLSGLITPRWLVGPPAIKETSKYPPLELIGYRDVTSALLHACIRAYARYHDNDASRRLVAESPLLPLNSSALTNACHAIAWISLTSSAFRERHGAVHAERRDLQSLHAVVRQDALREFQCRRLRDRLQCLPGMLEGLAVLLVGRPGGDVGDRDGRSAGMLRAEHRPQEHLQSGGSGASRRR